MYSFSVPLVAVVVTESGLIVEGVLTESTTYPNPNQNMCSDENTEIVVTKRSATGGGASAGLFYMCLHVDPNCSFRQWRVTANARREIAETTAARQPTTRLWTGLFLELFFFLGFRLNRCARASGCKMCDWVLWCDGDRTWRCSTCLLLFHAGRFREHCSSTDANCEE